MKKNRFIPCARCGEHNCFGGCIPFGYSEVIKIHDEVVITKNKPLTVKETFLKWRSEISESHWRLYKNMPNTLSEDAYAAGYLAGARRKRGSK